MNVYKILAINVQNSRVPLKLLTKDKLIYSKNLNALQGKADIVFSGITQEKQDLIEYAKLGR